jgi:hypothetical protein
MANVGVYAEISEIRKPPLWSEMGVSERRFSKRRQVVRDILQDTTTAHNASNDPHGFN